MVVFRRAGTPVVWGKGMGESGGPCTWRPFIAGETTPKFIRDDIAYVTCGFGHELRLSKTVHSVNPSGVVSPSYVCTAPSCTFHVFVRLEGWNSSEPLV